MGVLVQELFPQRLFLRVIGAQADDVPALIALFGDQFINRMLIGGNHRFWAGICAEVAVGLPALEADAFGVKLRLNRAGVGAVPDRRLRIGHGKELMRSCWDLLRMNVVKTLNLRVMARRVAVAANQLHSAQTRGLGGIKFLMDIRQEQDGAGAWPVFSNVTVGLHLAFGAYRYRNSP